MKNIMIKDPILSLTYYLNMFFSMVLIEEKKSKKFYFWIVKKDTAFILLDKFFDYFNYAEKNVVY